MKNEDAGDQGTSRVSREAILAHFQNRPVHDSGWQSHDAACHLMRLILDHHDFQGIESLIEYCENYDNLRPWLLLEADRIIFATELARGLRDMLSGANGHQPSGMKDE